MFSPMSSECNKVLRSVCCAADPDVFMLDVDVVDDRGSAGSGRGDTSSHKLKLKLEVARLGMYRSGKEDSARRLGVKSLLDMELPELYGESGVKIGVGR